METTIFTDTQKLEVLQRQKGMCGKCGKKVDENIDGVEFDVFSLTNQLKSDFQCTENHNDLVLLCKMCHNSITNGGSDIQLDSLKKYQYPHANFTNYSYDELFKDIKERVHSVANYSNNVQPTELKFAKVKLKDTRLALRGMNLQDENFTELESILKQTEEGLNKMQAVESEKYEEETNKNYGLLKSQVDEAVNFAKDTIDFSKAREMLINTQNQFKDHRLKREQRDELLSKLTSTFDDLSQRQRVERERYEMECIENYHSIKSKIDEAFSFISNSKNFSKSREALIKVQGDFKGLKLKKEQREEQYSRIQRAFDDLNEKQRAERDVYEQECNENFANLSKIVEESINFANTTTDFKEARESLIKTQQTIKGFKLNREQRDQLFQNIREVFNDLNVRQEEYRSQFDKENQENYERISKKIDNSLTDLEMLSDFRHIRENLIAIQGEVMILNIKREFRSELFTKIRNAFTILDNKRNEYREHKRIEKLTKLQSMLGNLENKALRLNESIDRDKDILSNFVTRVSQITTNDEESIKAELNTKIDTINVRIKEKEISLQEVQQKTQDIQKELDMMQIQPIQQ